MPSDSGHSGFTLLEVLVAVMIAATLLLSADVVFEQLVSSRDGAARSTEVRDRKQNAEALIRGWVRQVDVSPLSDPSSRPHFFVGDSGEAKFTSWCVAAGGWERECEVSLRTTVDSSGVGVLAVSSAGDSARIQMPDSTVALRFLIDANGGGRWVGSWPSGPTVPIAIGIVSPSDTIVYRVGARG